MWLMPILAWCVLLGGDDVKPDLLDTWRWDKRPVLVFADRADELRLKQQLARFDADAAGLLERAMVVAVVYADGGTVEAARPLSRDDAAGLRSRFKVEPGQFLVLLIGKDGGVKLRRADVVEPRELFDLIDSMPMRQQELREAADSR